MTFTIATWNVNSLKVRLPHVLEWLAQNPVDILALQETKMLDDKFPLAQIVAAGYTVIYNGQATYNGVAILSRMGATDLTTAIPLQGDDPQRRVLAATIGQVRVVNLYVPNGESITSTKYQYKLAWFANLTTWIAAEMARHPNIILLGDFNIAPTPEDVYDAAEWFGQVLFSEPEKAALKALCDLGLQDCFRLHPQAPKSFSWWDYRMNAFPRNRGVRIDHILASATLAPRCTRCFIDKTPRSWERPSDHTPVVAEFDFGL